ncbi:GntR family transcriptional regulator [Catellatospora methionotrophica]|uniref:GntR family transcriptional regulator n=1 Tax=Catellatospora methionotrophica TaxID=121620 RepID=A0A8J3PE77_9ACTN|nr:winged helix-turn-helix domain-containing protein [Catellatospora methionotrophica]GIG14281.1 GntR family transcriptional regulator [Catellatospora methionotrophica]
MSTQLEGLGALNPDDGRPASQQIANVLRAAIRGGSYGPGERLPTQSELADHYGVARETVKAALRTLRDERLIVTRQGSGAFVRAQSERPVGLRPHVEDLFTSDVVTIDFAGLSAETLHGILAEPLDKIRAGQLTPRSLVVRMLLPDMTQPTALPTLAPDGTDDPGVRQRMNRIVRRHTEAIADTIAELGALGLVKEARSEVRFHRAGAMFKLYILNGEEVFFGFYPVMQHAVAIKGEQVAIFDAMGKDATLMHFLATDDPTATDPTFIEQARNWFESVWATIAHEVPE